MAYSSKLSNIVGRLDVVVDMAEHQNRKKKNLESLISELSSDYNELCKYIKLYDTILKVLQGKAATYRNQRKTTLEETTTKVLRQAFPNEEYEIKIDWDSSGVRPTAQILNAVRNKKGELEYYPPAHINGELAKQIIAYTTLCNMCIMLNADFMGYDECLNSGDNDSLTDIKPLFDKLMETLQIVMIEHKDFLYANLDRREIHIDKVGGSDDEPMSGETKIIDVREVRP